MKSIIDSSVFCVSNEDFRDYLKGIRFELNGSKLEIFTSDGHRMAILETQLANQTSSGSFGAIITKKCAAQLSKILNDSGRIPSLFFAIKTAYSRFLSFHPFKREKPHINRGIDKGT